MKKSLWLAVATAALFFGSARRADAASWFNGYVCHTTREHSNASTGTNGYVEVILTNGSGCTGGTVGTFTVCGLGATATGCQDVRADDATLASMVDQFTHAYDQSHYVSIYAYTGGAVNGILDWAY